MDALGVLGERPPRLRHFQKMHAFLRGGRPLVQFEAATGELKTRFFIGCHDTVPACAASLQGACLDLCNAEVRRRFNMIGPKYVRC
jgi:hypothetical protein